MAFLSASRNPDSSLSNPSEPPRASEFKLVLLFLASASIIGCLFVIVLAGSDNYTPYILFKPKEIPYSHGWPWQFAERACPADAPWAEKRFAIWKHITQWQTQNLVADLSILLVAIALVLLVARRIWRSRGLRFTLGTAALGLTAACGGMGYVSYHMRLARREIEVNERLELHGDFLARKQYCGPRWWLQLAGHSGSFWGTLHHHSQVHLGASSQRPPEMGRIVASLPYLRTIDASDCSDADLHQFLAAGGSWPSERLEWRGHFTGEGLAELHRCPRLKELVLISSEAQPTALQHAAQCPRLEDVWLYRLDDAGARHLAACPRLRILEAPDTQLSDAGLATLYPCQQLEEINLRGSKLTERSISGFRKFPKLKRLSVGPFVERQPEDRRRFEQMVQELGIAEAQYHAAGKIFAHTPGE